MSGRRSNETLWCTIMEVEYVLGLFLPVYPSQFTQIIGQLVLMCTTPVTKGNTVARLCYTDWGPVRGWWLWHYLTSGKQVER